MTCDAANGTMSEASAKARLQIVRTVLPTTVRNSPMSHTPMIFSLECSYASDVSSGSHVCAYRTKLSPSPPTKDARMESSTPKCHWS